MCSSGSICLVVSSAVLVIIYLFGYGCVCLFVRFSRRMFVCLFACLLVCLCVCGFACACGRLRVHVSGCFGDLMFVCVFVYFVGGCLFACLPVLFSGVCACVLVCVCVCVSIYLRVRVRLFAVRCAVLCGCVVWLFVCFVIPLPVGVSVCLFGCLLVRVC